MDAERVFKLVAETHSTVRFATGEGIVLHFNELRICPTALRQMGLTVNEHMQMDLQEILRVTSEHKYGIVGENGNGDLDLLRMNTLAKSRA
ncbi:hypothetical protein WR25_21167 [Diploscapter pachys]|uniref:Uncharacterized protein n=1 Tax=Diploscapter pachys TaxID=2018661 RepID=A0A2A2LEL3_9BILA|nr:hypothetical protein WR25_21167 [Diploscapter pachys]